MADIKNIKPLYATLKRVKIGEYLYSKDFEYFAIENDIDEAWNYFKKEISKKSNVIILGYHDSEDEEEAFFLLMCSWYEDNYFSFNEFILPILLNFAKWKNIKIDFTEIITSLKKTGISGENILKFTQDLRKIQINKPLKIKDEKISTKHIPELIPQGNKVFVIHGHDDKSRLELCNILKDEFGLIPVVLQEEPNQTIETVISKFERLAADCSCAIALFTPDDKVEGNNRARQNVILELGYFLGKFHDTKERKILILRKGKVEIPSDINGVLYLGYTNSPKEIFYDLKRHLDAWGLNYKK